MLADRRCLMSRADTVVSRMTAILPHQWVKTHAGDTPDALAVVFGDMTITYGELDRMADEDAHRLIREGITPGDLVPRRAAAPLDMMIAMVSIPRAGGVIAPYGPHRLCLLYTSDAADDLLCVDLGGRRIIKKK